MKNVDKMNIVGKEISEENYQALIKIAETDKDPVYFVTFLKLREGEAKYEDSNIQCSAQEAIGKYLEGAKPIFEKCGGSVTLMGDCKQSIITPKGKNWDRTVLAKFTTAKGFLDSI